jgi:hypothetical protein
MTDVFNQRYLISLLIFILLFTIVVILMAGQSQEPLFEVPKFYNQIGNPNPEPCSDDEKIAEIRRNVGGFFNGKQHNHSTLNYEVGMKSLNNSLKVTNSNWIVDIANALKALVVGCDGKW